MSWRAVQDFSPAASRVQSMGSPEPSNSASDAGFRGLSPCFFSRPSIFSTSPIGVPAVSTPPVRPRICDVLEKCIRDLLAAYLANLPHLDATSRMCRNEPVGSSSFAPLSRLSAWNLQAAMRRGPFPRSVRQALLATAEVYPEPRNAILVLPQKQREMLAPFGPTRSTNG